MKKFIKIILIFLLNISLTYFILYIEVFSKVLLVGNGVELTRNIISENYKVLVGENAILNWDINIDSWEIILENNSVLNWNIKLKNGILNIKENVIVDWNIEVKWEIYIWKWSEIKWDINLDSDLNIHSQAKISWTFPKLFKTIDYPDFLSYFWSLPEKHKKAFWYIFLTNGNMSIRWKDLKPEEYFKDIFYYEDNKLKKLDFSNTEKLKKLYEKAKYYVNLIPERKVGRFGVGFVTKTYANDKNFADMYLSYPANNELFMHETGHVLDYKYWFIDTARNVYPYYNKDNSITEYWKFHKWEDFAEAYRYYVLYSDYFKKFWESNSEKMEKYNYLKNEVFDWIIY